MKCINCGKDFESKFCPECGARVQDGMDLCPVCGKERNDGEKFCSNCGYNFDVQNNVASQEVIQNGSNKLGKSKALTIITKIYRWLIPVGMLVLGIISLLCLCAPTVTEEFLGMKNNCCSGFVAIGDGVKVDIPDSVVNASRVLLIISIIALVYGAVQLFLSIKKPYKTIRKFPLWIVDGIIALILIVIGGVVDTIARKEGVNGKAGAGFMLCIVMGALALVFLATRIFYEIKVFKWEHTGLSAEQVAQAKEKKEHKKINKKAILAIVLPVVVVALLIAIIVPTVKSATSIFSASKVDKVNLGDSQGQVINVLGEPYEKSDYRYVYYSDNYVKILDQIDKLTGNRRSLIANMSDDDWDFDWDDDIGESFSELDNLYQQLNQLTYKYIRVYFDNDKKVSEVFFDNNKNDSRSAEENNKSVKEYNAIGNTTLQQYDTLKLTYTVKYDDGSLYKATAVEQVYFDVTKSNVEWKDLYGNRFTALLNVTPITKLTSEVISYVSSGNKASLTEFEIASNITAIDTNTFEGCVNLTSIAIPDSVSTIGAGAFSDCDKLTIYCNADSKPSGWASNWNADSTVYWGSIGGYVQGGITYVVSKSGSVSMIVPKTISGKVVIASAIELKESQYYVTSISNDIFSNCVNMTSVEIPSSVTSIGATAFDGCSKLESIKVDERNSKYASQDGILYNKAKTTFVYVPKAIKGALSIPDGITSISESLFQGCGNITSLELADSVKSIGNHAFNNCVGLTSITIPSGITSIGDNAFISCDNLTTATLPTFALDYISKNKLQNVVINGGTSIDERAFYNCANLKSIEMNSASLIGAQAFYNCTNLTRIDLPSNVTIIGSNAFYGCDNLMGVYITDIASWCNIEFANAQSNPLTFAHKLYLNNALLTKLEIPSEVESIGSYAFYGCTGLVEINIPINVSTIGLSVFTGCDNVTSANVPASAIAILPKSNLQTVVINGGDRIADGAFADCANLVSVSISSSVSIIGSTAFSGCSKLASVQVDANNAYYVSIDGLLYNKQKTEIVLVPRAVVGRVAIPNGVSTISGNAFADCLGLTAVEIPVSVTSIGEDAFSGCENLTAVYISDIDNWCGLTFVNAQSNPLALAGQLYVNDALTTSIDISEGVTSIGVYAFYGWSNLTSIFIPGNIASIGENAFTGCSNITSATLPTNAITSITRSKLQKVVINGGEEIPGMAFINCSNLTSIDLGNSVTSIGQFAFSGCTSLQNIKIPSSVTSIAWRTFNECSNLKSVTFENTNGWYYSPTGGEFNTINANVTNPSTNATNITLTYLDYYWKRNS